MNPTIMTSNTRILTTGESWYGCTGRSCNAALRRLGHEVFEVNVDNYFPQWRNKSSRVVGRLLFPLMLREFNDVLVRSAEKYRPDFFLAYKGPTVTRATLQKLRELKIPSCNYFPDTSAFSHGRLLPLSLPEYDCVFYTKPFWLQDTRKKITVRDASFLPLGYDSKLHTPSKLRPNDKSYFASDVTVVGSHTPYKAEVLGGLLRLRPALRMRIWGNRWETCDNQAILARWEGSELVGNAYAQALQVADINLALLTGMRVGASQGDDVTTRTFEIPACGGFMLHERNPEVAELFIEGKEIACYATVEELAEKIDYYLAHPEERKVIAEAGYRRCVPAYSYDNRMQTILEWHARSASATKAAVTD